MEKDGTQMKGCHSVRGLGNVGEGERGGKTTNDRFICMHQQHRERRRRS